MNCIDLKERFGQRCRIRYEDTDRRGRDPWLAMIDCRHGHIYPHGGDLIGASTNNRGAIAKRLAALACVRVVQDGDDGINVVFNAADFLTVAAVMKPKRRRSLTPAQATERTERLRKYRFSPASQNDFRGRKTRPASQTTVSPDVFNNG